MAHLEFAPDWLEEAVTDYVKKRGLDYSVQIFVNAKMKVSNGMPAKIKIMPNEAQRTPDVRPNIIIIFNDEVFSRLSSEAQDFVLLRLFQTIKLNEEDIVVKNAPDFCEHMDLIKGLSTEENPLLGYALMEQNMLAVHSVLQDIKEEEEAAKELKKSKKSKK